MTFSGNNKQRPLGELIGMPVNSCLKAEVSVGEAFVRYVRNAGFIHSREYMELLHVSTISFTFTQSGLKRRITVPLLTIVPMPLLLIDRVDMNYILNVNFDESGKTVCSFGNKAGNGWGYNKDTRFAQQMKMSVKVERYALPVGISKMLDLATNKGIQSRPFSPSNFRPYEKEHVSGLCGILEGLQAKQHGEILGILDSLLGDVKNYKNKSPMFLEYLRLRKLPIEYRAQMPYTTIVQNGRIVYSDCCNFAEVPLMVSGFGGLVNPYVYPLNDIVDDEDLGLAHGFADTLESLITQFGYTEFMEKSDPLEIFEQMMKMDGLRLKSNVNIGGEIFSFVYEVRNCIIDFYRPPYDLEEEQELIAIQKRKVQIAQENKYMYLPFLYDKLLTNPRLVEDSVLAKLDLLSREKRYSASKCQIYEIDKFTASMFHNAYCMDGNGVASVNLALGYKGKLLQVVSIEKDGDFGIYQIVAISHRHGCYVVAGVSRLLKYFMNKYNCKSITAMAEKSFCDIYKNLGFKLEDTYPVGTDNSLSGLNKFVITPSDPMPSPDFEKYREEKVQKSNSLLQYIELRKIPIEQRAQMDYSFVVKDNRMVYTDCCRV